jgi:hypothetical protein
MDHHYQYKSANTYQKLIKEGIIKPISDLNNAEVLSLIDNLFVLELLWANGKPIYQTIMNLVYFTDPDINREKTDDNLFRIYLDSSMQIVYTCYSHIFSLCNCVREEDISLIPLTNIDFFKRPKAAAELKKAENNLRTLIKTIDKENPERKIITSLINRFSARRTLLKIFEESVNLIFNFSLI